MAQYFTESEHLQFREADLDQQRVLGLGNAFTRVPFGSTYNQERVMKLGFAFTNVPMSVAQEDYIRMRTAQGASAQEDSFSQTGASFPDLDLILRGAEGSSSYASSLGDKWSWVKTPGGGAQLIDVIEDSGSDDNFISMPALKRLGLRPVAAPTLVHRMIDGHTFFTNQHVEIAWFTTDMEGTDYFRVVLADAPPMSMLVGKQFSKKYPDALMLERPQSRDILLTVQTRMKKGEAEKIAVLRGRMDMQAEEIARRRQSRQAGVVLSATPQRVVSRQVEQDEWWEKSRVDSK